MKKAIVTGGAGFIGSHVVENLLDHDMQVLVVDNFSTNAEEEKYARFMEDMEKRENFLGNVDHDLQQDFRGSVDSLVRLFCGFDYVFHLAAHPRVQPSIDDPLNYHDLNVDTTLNILEAARLAKVEKVVFSSSSSIYGDPEVIPTTEDHPKNPMSPYGLHKQIGEEYCKLYTLLYGLKTVCLRYMNVYGERQPSEGAYVPVIGIWDRQFLNGQPLEITGDGTQTRDFVYVKDVAESNYLAAVTDFDNKHEFFNVGSGVNYEINEIASWYNTKTKHIEKRFEPHTTKADVSKLKKLTGWEPTMGLSYYVKKKNGTL